MSHSLSQSHTSTSDSPDDQSNHPGHASRNQPPANEYSQDYAHSSKSTPSSSSTTTAVTGPSSPVKSNSPTQSCPSASMSQPTTPRPTSGSSTSTTQQRTESTTTQLPSSSSPPRPSQHETLSFSLPLPPPTIAAAYPYMANNGDNNGKRKRQEFDYTSDTPTFGMGRYNGNIYATDRSTILDVAVHAKVDRGFFLADNDWTCYRRNYFQISAALALQGVAVLYDGQELPCFVRDDRHTLHPVEQFYIGISARLSDGDKQITLVQHTAKRDKGPQNTPEPKPVRPGGNLSFSSVGTNQSIVTFERIQFKSATANNGKRRAAQQYYVVVIELFAKIHSSDKMIPVASTASQHLVVRGRSPGHYAESSSSSSPSTSECPSIRQHHQPYPYYQHYPPPTTTFASTPPPMIPGHHHPAPPPPPGMYTAPGYPAYHYPPTPTTSTHSANDMHYAYAPPLPPPPHAGVPMVSNAGPSVNGHSPTTSQHPTTTPPHVQTMPPRPLPPFGHSYQPHYSSPLPLPMHRSESAPSTYEQQPAKEDHTQQQQQQTSRFRVASTPGHPYHATTTTTTSAPSSTTDHTGHAPSFTVSMPPYSQPPSVSYYYSPTPHFNYSAPPPPPSHLDSAPPPPSSQANHGYPSNWKQWYPPNHMTQQHKAADGNEKQEAREDIKTEPIHKMEGNTRHQ